MSDFHLYLIYTLFFHLYLHQEELGSLKNIEDDGARGAEEGPL